MKLTNIKINSYLRFFKFFLIFLVLSLLQTISTKSNIKKSNRNTKLKTTLKRASNDYGRLSKLSQTVPKNFELDTAKNFRDLAGLGYIDTESATEQISEIKNFLATKKWIQKKFHIYSKYFLNTKHGNI